MAEITQQQLDDFKSLFPDNPRFQALTLDEVLGNTRGLTVDWNALQVQQAAGRAAAAPAAISLTPCEMAVGWVVYDVICLALGAVGLRASVGSEYIEQIGEAALPVMSNIETYIAQIAAPNASYTDMAWGVFNILKVIYNGGCLGAVFLAFCSSLNWWNMILYGITGAATILAALGTDGVAFVAQVVLLLATFGFLATDAVNAASVCGLVTAESVAE